MKALLFLFILSSLAGWQFSKQNIIIPEVITSGKEGETIPGHPALLGRPDRFLKPVRSVDRQLSDWFKPLENPDTDFLKKQQTDPTHAPKIFDLKHTVLHYSKETYCGHPRMVNFKYFPPNEIIVGHFHAPSKYQEYDDVRHISYQSRSVCMLQRSTDMGETWPKKNDVILFDNTIPKEEKLALGKRTSANHKEYNMFNKNSVFFFANTIQYPLDSTFNPALLCFRSPDRGLTWTESPYAIPAHSVTDGTVISKQNTPIIQMPDGKTLLGSFWISHTVKKGGKLDSPDGSAIYYSKDQGLTWQFLSRPVRDRSGTGVFIYEILFLLPNSDLHFYSVHLSNKDVVVDGLKNAITLCVSKDGGKTWTGPVPITGKGSDIWGKVDDSKVEYKITYRAPWPILLKDGRILVVFTRRKMPAGIGGIVSSDGGKTWSDEFIIRNDAKWWDIGYPVGCQLSDGRIFISYYYNIQDGNKQGGTRFIAGSFFRIGD